MIREDVCTHYNGFYNDELCKAGVQYGLVIAVQPGTVVDRSPCFSKNGLSFLCAKFCLPPKEEIAENERATNEFIERMVVTRKAITDHIKEHRVEGRNVEGRIPCPVCSDGTVFYSCAGAYNGHIHATCNTDGCVSWIE